MRGLFVIVPLCALNQLCKFRDQRQFQHGGFFGQYHSPKWHAIKQLQSSMIDKKYGQETEFGAVFARNEDKFT